MNVRIRNQRAELNALLQAVEQFAARHRLSAVIESALLLAVEESFVNIITHGGADGREHEVSVSLQIAGGEVEVAVRDDGPPFNPLDLPPPDTSVPLRQRALGGLGIHLLRRTMDSIEYRRDGSENVLTMRKRWRE